MYNPFPDRRYCKNVPVGLLNSAAVEKLVETSVSSLWVNHQGNKAVATYIGPKPVFLTPYEDFNNPDFMVNVNNDPDYSQQGVI